MRNKQAERTQTSEAQQKYDCLFSEITRFGLILNSPLIFSEQTRTSINAHFAITGKSFVWR